MAYEVVNTSAEKGLVPNQAGFCDVLRTHGIPDEICSLLKPMSRYDYELSGDQPAFAIRVVRLGATDWGVISRIVPCGLDYTGRKNRLAHHVVVPPSEFKEVNPASVIAHFQFRNEFIGAARYGQDMPNLQSAKTPIVSGAWAKAGLQNWESELAKTFQTKNDRFLLLLPVAVDARRLMAELASMLTTDQQWRLGLCIGSDAASAWNEGVRLRVLLAETARTGPAWAAWPGEVGIDLRACPAAPTSTSTVEINHEINDTQGDSERWVSLQTAIKKEPEAPLEIIEEPIVIDFGSEEIFAPPPIPIPVTKPSPIKWGIMLLWLVTGVIAGALIAFILSKVV